MVDNKARYKELRGKTSQENVAEYLGCTTRTYRDYEKGVNPMPLEYIIKLSKLYNVSIEYLLGLDDCEHVENSNISNMTGLSNKSIEVLRELESNKSRVSDTERVFGIYTREGDLSHRSIDFINYVLEECYDVWLNEVKRIKSENTKKLKSGDRENLKRIPVLNSVFMYMYQSIFSGRMKCIIPNTQKDNYTMADYFSGHTGERELDELVFYDEHSGLKISGQASALWNTYNMNVVNKWLNDKREEVDKNGKH